MNLRCQLLLFWSQDQNWVQKASQTETRLMLFQLYAFWLCTRIDSQPTCRFVKKRWFYQTDRWVNRNSIACISTRGEIYVLTLLHPFLSVLVIWKRLPTLERSPKLFQPVPFVKTLPENDTIILTLVLGKGWSATNDYRSVYKLPKQCVHTILVVADVWWCSVWFRFRAKNGRYQ